MATTPTPEPAERSAPALTVLVVEHDEDIRHALVDLFEDEGYWVLEAENLRIAEHLVYAFYAPLALLIGDAELADYRRLEFFTAVAANPVTNHACIYLTSTSIQWRLPELVEILKTVQISVMD
jgi:DNA-binding response OmpR family regulator